MERRCIALDRIKEILRDQDVEGYIRIHGTPDDEYDSEAEALAALLQDEPHLTGDVVLAALVQVWEKYFNLDEDDMKKRVSHLEKVARLLIQYG